jgi:UTP--glucose-1-phosphate uridylyltransferase
LSVLKKVEPFLDFRKQYLKMTANNTSLSKFEISTKQPLFLLFAQRMRQHGLSELAIEAFRQQYQQLVQQVPTTINESQLSFFKKVPDLEKLSDYSETGRQALAQTVMIKLNGGLGTGMGLDRAKSLLSVKDSRTFLDVIADHVVHFRKKYDVNFPLILMNSFKTEEDSLAALARHPNLALSNLPLSFIQNQVPRISEQDLQPLDWPQNPPLAWCPPGHGNIYTALVDTRLLQKLLALNYKYAYVSNADNLGSMLDLQILGYFASSRASFMMEVADRKEGDRKGGHLGRYKNGRWMLRELAQCPADELDQFQDITRHAYFNTNNIWWYLPRLWEVLKQHNFIMKLPLICNQKIVDPFQPNSPKVYQLETAVGSALELFEDAQVIRVPRSRQIAVKHWSELIVVRSDAFVTAADGLIVLNPVCKGHQPLLKLDERFYKFEQDIVSHFPQGLPSLSQCYSLEIKGNFVFGKNVTICGKTRLIAKNPDSDAPVYIPDHSFLTGDIQI